MLVEIKAFNNLPILFCTRLGKLSGIGEYRGWEIGGTEVENIHRESDRSAQGVRKDMKGGDVYLSFCWD